MYVLSLFLVSTNAAETQNKNISSLCVGRKGQDRRNAGHVGQSGHDERGG